VHILPSALAALDAQHVIVVGSSTSDRTRGAIATTADGGRTWTSRALNMPPPNGVAARGTTVLVTADCPKATGPDCVWISTDSGGSFTDLPEVPRLVHPGLVDEKRGFVMTPLPYGTTLWVTDDAGATWAQTGDACVSGPTVAIDFPSPEVSWTACAGPGTTGQEGRAIWKSNWEGSSLQMMSSVGLGLDTGALPSSGTLLGISMTADGHGWLWTNDRLYTTSDAGRTWGPVKMADTSASSSVAAADLVTPQTGFAILNDGASPVVARTDDGGASWTELTSFPI
jgi:photosystem II stability/assembly factor-like uncharacterized protein